MDLILWRHAYARRIDNPELVNDESDLARELTPRGHAQAKASAKWLRRHLSASTKVLCSPAIRCQETAAYLEMDVRLVDRLKPSANASDILDVAKWPECKSPVLVVGHQPALGEVLAQLLQCSAGATSVRKSGIWWLRHRVRDGVGQTTVVTVVSPDMVV